MTKKELEELLGDAVRGEVKRRMAAREGELAELTENVDQHKVRIAALEDDYNRAMREIGALHVIINATKSSTAAGDIPPAPPSTPSLLSSPSRKAPSHHTENSAANSMYGGKDYESSPRATSSPGHASGVSGPQLDKETEDELAELGGWGLDEEASEEVSDGDITDEDAEGEIDEESDEVYPPYMPGDETDEDAEDDSYEESDDELPSFMPPPTTNEPCPRFFVITRPSKEVSDVTITDKDAEGETDERSDVVQPLSMPSPTTNEPRPQLIKLDRRPIRPLAQCKTKGARNFQA